MIPTPEQFLAKLEANPNDGLAFDAATRRERPHCRSRREAVEAVLAAVRATIAETQAMKAKLAASRQKAAALEAARKSQPVSFMKTTPTPPQAPTATAESFATAPLTMLRSDFVKLSAADKTRFVKAKGQLI